MSLLTNVYSAQLTLTRARLTDESPLKLRNLMLRMPGVAEKIRLIHVAVSKRYGVSHVDILNTDDPQEVAMTAVVLVRHVQCLLVLIDDMDKLGEACLAARAMAQTLHRDMGISDEKLEAIMALGTRPGKNYQGCLDASASFRPTDRDWLALI